MSVRKRFLVEQTSLESATAHLPAVLPFAATTDIDLYIASAGFEPRVLAIPSELLKNHVNVRNVILGRYRTNVTDNARREAELRPLLEMLGASITFCDAESPSHTNEAIQSLLTISSERCMPVRVALDISGASSSFIFSMMGALVRSGVPINVSIFYATAKAYYEPSTGREVPAAQWSFDDLRETGVADVQVNELFPGIHHDYLPVAAIAIPSMFVQRLERCLSFLGLDALTGPDPGVHFILPNTTDREHQWRINHVWEAIGSLVRAKGGGADVPLILDRIQRCDVFNYIDIVRATLKLIEDNSGSNCTIIHMGTKLQAIGVALVLAARTEVALVGARPSSFAASTYSDGVGALFQVNLGDVQDIVANISRVGSLEVRATNI